MKVYLRKIGNLTRADYSILGCNLGRFVSKITKPVVHWWVTACVLFRSPWWSAHEWLLFDFSGVPVKTAVLI